MHLRLLAISSLFMILTACGQKGPLLLPDEPATHSSSAKSVPQTQETNEQ